MVLVSTVPLNALSSAGWIWSNSARSRLMALVMSPATRSARTY